MPRPRRLFLALAAPAMAVVAFGAGPARAQEAPSEVGSAPAHLTVSVTADPATLVIELGPEGGPAATARITYDIRVANTGDGIVPGVEVVDRLPSGLTVDGQREVRFAVGDLNAANVVRQVIVADVDPSALGGATRVVNVAEAVSSDGQRATSEPAVTDVTVISARVVERPAPPASAPVAPTAPPAEPQPEAVPVVSGLGDTAAARERLINLAGEPARFQVPSGPGARGASPWPIALAASGVMLAGAAGVVAARSRVRRLARPPA